MDFRIAFSVGARRLKAAVDGDRPKDHARPQAAYASHWQP